MKSKELKIYNIPRDVPPLLVMSIKPTKLLVWGLFISSVCICFMIEYSIIFLAIVAICLFALVAMPDRTLLEIYQNTLIIYDSRQANNCFCIYWDELLTWQYQKLQTGDKLILVLIDGQEVVSDVYRSYKLMMYLNTLAKNKEKKVVRRRGRIN